ncbi:hypothetical protein JL721_12499 [Aureococcus anophagefferens]|nr:hypothetical protein JL721_12499 [Aureococcus anophagefferens]
MASSRIVIALDCDCFYAQCEVLRTPALRGKPVGVRQKMLVITSSYEARAFGIKKGDSLAEVRRKCPEITICDGEDLTFYTETSNRWRAFVEAHCKGCAVERLGLDELFVDATAIVDKRLREGAAAPHTSPVRHAAGEARAGARGAAFCEDCARARDALGLETSGGVGSWHKPYQQTTLAPTADNVRLALPDDLDVRKITGVGFRAAEALASLGVRAVGELRDLRSGDGVLDDAAVARFRGLARGVDDDPVKHTGRARARKSPPGEAAARGSAPPPPKRPKSTMAAFLAKPPRPPAAPRPPDGGLDRILEMASALRAPLAGRAATRRAIETLLTS